MNEGRLEGTREIGAHAPGDAAALTATPLTGGLTLSVVERDLIEKALASAQYNKSKAAKLPGVPRGRFYSLLQRHGLTSARR